MKVIMRSNTGQGTLETKFDTNSSSEGVTTLIKDKHMKTYEIITHRVEINTITTTYHVKSKSLDTAKEALERADFIAKYHTTITEIDEYFTNNFGEKLELEDEHIISTKELT